MQFYRFKSWDKYSWFLYQSGKYDEALLANKNAQKLYVESLELNTDFNNDEYFAEQIKEHEQNIIQRNWDDFIDNYK